MSEFLKNKLTSRKFILAVIGTIVSSAGLFLGVMSGTEWITAQTLIYGLFTTTNVVQKKIEKDDNVV